MFKKILTIVSNFFKSMEKGLINEGRVIGELYSSEKNHIELSKTRTRGV